MKTLAILAVSSVLATPILAEVNVAFKEGAPKDRFVLTNSGTCDLDAVSITLDLESSASGIIFDVASSGPGVEVFQPLQIVTGKNYVSETPQVSDGDRTITLHLNSFPQGETVAFTIDVDDTGGGREITVAGSEIAGATASLQTAARRVSAAFSNNAQANVPLLGCS